MVTSIGTPGRRARARCARRRRSKCRRAASAADRRRDVDDIEQRRADRAPAMARSRSCAQLAAIEQRVGIGPFLRRVAEPLRRLRRPQRLAQLPQHAVRSRSTSLASNARSTATSQSCGVRNLRASSRQASGRSTSAARPSAGRRRCREHARRDRPPRRRFVAHEVRDQLGRDESRGGRMAAQRADRALAFVDAAFVVVAPSTVLLPGSCSSSWNANPIGLAGSARCGAADHAAPG